ncbi:MAG: transposase [Pseudoxanthomonas sp.]
MNTIDDEFGRQRRRKHSAEFKAKVIAACRKPGVSMSAVALAHRLNANLLRRWVIAEEQTPAAKPGKAVSATPSGAVVESRAFIPIQVESSVKTAQEITIELRRGAMVVKVGWPVAAAADCAAWLRELLR